MEILRQSGARVLGAGSIVDRSGGTADVGVPRVALATLQVISYPPDDCPLCRQGVPVVKPGSRHIMRRIRIKLAYDGTDFHGWQVQPGLPTIQGMLEEIVSGIEGVRCTWPGRAEPMPGSMPWRRWPRSAGESDPGFQPAQGDQPAAAAADPGAGGGGGRRSRSIRASTRLPKRTSTVSSAARSA